LIGSYVHILDPVIPWVTLHAALISIYSVEISQFGWKVSRWLMSHLPFVGGKGV